MCEGIYLFYFQIKLGRIDSMVFIEMQNNPCWLHTFSFSQGFIFILSPVIFQALTFMCQFPRDYLVFHLQTELSKDEACLHFSCILNTIKLIPRVH